MINPLWPINPKLKVGLMPKDLNVTSHKMKSFKIKPIESNLWQEWGK